MQSYAEGWTERPRLSPKEDKMALGPKHDHRPLVPHQIPFQAAKLPLLARSRIRSPSTLSTPRKTKIYPTFAPRSTPLTPPQPDIPARQDLGSIASILEHGEKSNQLPTPPPTPIPFSSYSPIPSTPGLGFGGSTTSASTPRRDRGRTRLLTPVTPTHIRYDETGRPLARSTPGQEVDGHLLWSGYNLAGIPDEKIPETPVSRCRPTPPLSVLRSAPERPILECNTTAVPRMDNNTVPKLLHHVSSEGGPISALKRYVLASKQDPSLSGMSLFLHCPKKRVPHQSTERIRKERKIAMDWNDLLRISRNGRDTVKIVHAVHTMNLGSADPGTRLRSFLSLKAEMKYARALGIDILVFHPGSTGDEIGDKQVKALERLASDIKLLLDQVPSVVLAIENSTHRCRGQLGCSLLDLRFLISQAGPRLRVCLDLCHIHVDQYDLSIASGREAMFTDLDLIGWGNIAAIHVSDSKEKHGGKRDLHASLGRGTIGLNGIRAVLRHPQLVGKVPYLLETPKHLPHHFRMRRRSPSIQALDEELGRLERDCLRDLLAFSDEEWDDEDTRTRWWKAHHRHMISVRRKIGQRIKLRMGLMDGDEWIQRRSRL